MVERSKLAKGMKDRGENPYLCGVPGFPSKGKIENKQGKTRGRYSESGGVVCAHVHVS